MKNLLFIILIIGTAECFGQQDTAVSYTSVADVIGVSKEELYLRARDWLSNNLQSLQIQDKETGELSGKGIVEGKVTFRILGPHNANAIFNFNANIWVKDGRYKFSITNINNSSITYDNTTSTTRDDLSSAVGILYTSKHAKTKVFGLSKTKSDEAYQSAKSAFDELEKGLIESLNADMNKKSTPDF